MLPRQAAGRARARPTVQRRPDGGTLLNLALGLPVLASGAAIGVVLFRRIDNSRLRRVVLAVLLFAGVVLLVA